MENTKKCSKCGRELPIECFYTYNRSKDGYQCWCKDCQKEYFKENKSKIMSWLNNYNLTPKGRSIYLANRHKQHDKEKGLDNDIDAKWIRENIFSKECIYCGETDWTKLGCDRIDNSIGHVIDNVVPCCEKCNKERGRKPFDEFYNMKKGI